MNNWKVNLVFAIRLYSLPLSFCLITSFLLAFHFFHCSSFLCCCLFADFYIVMFISLSFLSYSLSLHFPRLFHFHFHIFFHSLLSCPILFFTQPIVLRGNPLWHDPVKSVLRTSVRKQATQTQGFAWVYSAALDEWRNATSALSTTVPCQIVSNSTITNHLSLDTASNFRYPYFLLINYIVVLDGGWGGVGVLFCCFEQKN
jgi:hypothetical protein